MLYCTCSSQTALHWAAKLGRCDFMSILVLNGAFVDIKSVSQHTYNASISNGSYTIVCMVWLSQQTISTIGPACMLGQAKLKILQRSGYKYTIHYGDMFDVTSVLSQPCPLLTSPTIPLSLLAISTSERKLTACSDHLFCHLCATYNTMHAITIVVRLMNFDLCPLYSSREGSHRCTWPVRVAMTTP